MCCSGGSESSVVSVNYTRVHFHLNMNSMTCIIRCNLAGTLFNQKGILVNFYKLTCEVSAFFSRSLLCTSMYPMPLCASSVESILEAPRESLISCIDSRRYESLVVIALGFLQYTQNSKGWSFSGTNTNRKPPFVCSCIISVIGSIILTF